MKGRTNGKKTERNANTKTGTCIKYQTYLKTKQALLVYYNVIYGWFFPLYNVTHTHTHTSTARPTHSIHYTCIFYKHVSK